MKVKVYHTRFNDGAVRVVEVSPGESIVTTLERVFLAAQKDMMRGAGEADLPPMCIGDVCEVRGILYRVAPCGWLELGDDEKATDKLGMDAEDAAHDHRPTRKFRGSGM